jgi:hypothetical protein
VCIVCVFVCAICELHAPVNECVSSCIICSHKYIHTHTHTHTHTHIHTQARFRERLFSFLEQLHEPSVSKQRHIRRISGASERGEEGGASKQR